MASSSKNVAPTAEEKRELAKMNIFKEMQMESLGPHRKELITTTAFGKKTAFVEGASLRLKNLDSLVKEGFLTLEEVQKVKLWRSAAAAGTVFVNPNTSSSQEKHFNPAKNTEKSLAAAKGTVVEDGEWEDLGEELVGEDFVLV